MSFNTLAELVGKVQQRVGLSIDYFLVQDWILVAYREWQRKTEWSWRRKKSDFVCYAPYTTGTVTINRGENIATFAGGAALTQNHVGQQLRAGGNNTPIRTIVGLIDSTHAYLDDNWVAATVTATTFEIYKAYYPMPSDFDGFISVVDTVRNFQLDWWNHDAPELDRTDAMRTYSGNIAYWVVLKDYASQLNGTVAPPVQAKGAGSKPMSGGIYSGPNDAVFTIEMTSATAFQWKKDEGGYTIGVSISATGAGLPIALQDGVQVSFPSSGVYVTGDLFTVRCSTVYGPDMPRYELWPHIKADEFRPFLYLAKLPDLDAPGATLPPYVNGEALVEMALASAARYADKDNGYFNLKLAMMHDVRAEAMLADAIREDEGREVTNVQYDSWTELPVYDSGYLAGHDVGYDGPSVLY